MKMNGVYSATPTLADERFDSRPLNYELLNRLMTQEPALDVERAMRLHLKRDPQHTVPLAQFCLARRDSALAKAVLEAGMSALRALDQAGTPAVEDTLAVRMQLWLQRMLLETTGTLMDVETEGFARWALQNREILGGRNSNLRFLFFRSSAVFYQQVPKDPVQSLPFVAMLTALASSQARYHSNVRVLDDISEYLKFYDVCELSDANKNLLSETRAVHRENLRLASEREQRHATFFRRLANHLSRYSPNMLKLPEPRDQKNLGSKR